MPPKKIHKEALRSLGKDLRINKSRFHPTLFVTEGLDPDTFTLNKFAPARKKLFEHSTMHYIPPKEFNFQLPKAERAEICFIGRSNVGKSSLIEAISGNSGIAKISKTPGCTKTLNFFAFVPHRFRSVPTITIDHHRAYLVDMPGYGYAKVSREEQERWMKVMNDYLLTRDQTVLRRTFLLLDGRHGLKTTDVDMMIMLNRCFIPYQLVFTKADLVKESDLVNNLKNAFGVMNQMSSCTCLPFIHTVSSTTRMGIETLQLALAEIYTDERYNLQYDNDAPPGGDE